MAGLPGVGAAVAQAAMAPTDPLLDFPAVIPIAGGEPPDPYGLLGPEGRAILRERALAGLQPEEPVPLTRGQKVMNAIGQGFRSFSAGGAAAGDPAATRATEAWRLAAGEAAAQREAEEGQRAQQLADLSALFQEDLNARVKEAGMVPPTSYQVEGIDVPLPPEKAATLTRQVGADRALAGHREKSLAATTGYRELRGGQFERDLESKLADRAARAKALEEGLGIRREGLSETKRHHTAIEDARRESRAGAGKDPGAWSRVTMGDRRAAEDMALQRLGVKTQGKTAGSERVKFLSNPANARRLDEETQRILRETEALGRRSGYFTDPSDWLADDEEDADIEAALE